MSHYLVKNEVYLIVREIGVQTGFTHYHLFFTNSLITPDRTLS